MTLQIIFAITTGNVGFSAHRCTLFKHNHIWLWSTIRISGSSESVMLIRFQSCLTIHAYTILLYAFGVLLMVYRGESCPESYSTYVTCHDSNSNCDTEERLVGIPCVYVVWYCIEHVYVCMYVCIMPMIKSIKLVIPSQSFSRFPIVLEYHGNLETWCKRSTVLCTYIKHLATYILTYM